MDFFTYTPKEYTQVRDLRINEHFFKQVATFIAHTKNIPYKKAYAWAEWAVKTNRLRYDDPMVKLLSKDKERDRHRTRMRFSEFTDDIARRDLIMTPTFTCYLPRKTMPSLLSKFTEERFYQRKATKKEGQKAKSYGDYELAKYKDVIQKKQKIDINSISGALSIGSTPFANRSGHSTLTSVCRIATAMANANTERFLQGRRHLWDYDTVVDNINTVLTYADLTESARVIEKYGLKLITHQELFESLKYSWDSYMKSEVAEKQIYAYIKTLTQLECTTYLYMGDFYHLCKYNDGWVRNHITHILGYKDIPPIPKEEVKQELAWVDEFFTPLLSMTLSHWIGTLSPFAPEHEDKEYYGYIGAYARYLNATMREYEDYYKCFWRNEFIPAEAAMFPHVHRRAVLGGDTDSTLLTTYQWVDWYCGTLEVKPDTKIVAGIFIFYLTMLVKHSLAFISGVIGIEENYIHNMKMKNEFYFDVFSPSNRTKHYISNSTVCEGLNQAEPELLIKGVALKNSKAKPAISEQFTKLVVEVMDKIAVGEQIELDYLIDYVAKIEAQIFESLMHGSIEFLTSRAIKVKEAYKLPMSSDYTYHVLWQEVFGEKYGMAPEPPYGGVRISMNLPNQTAVKMWLDSLDDQVVAERFRQFMTKHDKKGFASIILPHEIVVSSGIPDELKPIINARKIILANMEPYYILLEMFNVGFLNKWLTKFCLDQRIEYIREDLRPYFDISMQSKLDEIRQKSKGQGVQVEVDEEDMDDELEFEDEE